MPHEIPELQNLPEDQLESVLSGGLRYAFGPENLAQPYEVVIRSGSTYLSKWTKLRERAKRQERESGIKSGANIDDFVEAVCS